MTVKEFKEELDTLIKLGEVNETDTVIIYDYEYDEYKEVLGFKPDDEELEVCW